VFLSRDPVQTVLNVDVGGGTSKLALVRDGEILTTCAINVGGRLLAYDPDRRLTRIEPAARVVAEATGITLALGQVLSPAAEQVLAERLAACLLEAIRSEPLSPLAQALLLTPPLEASGPIEAVTFSGGVAEYLYGVETHPFGDLAPALAGALATAIEAERLPAPLYGVGERIRATVLGAAQFTVQVSGDTIAITRPELLPLHNLPVLDPRLPERADPSAAALAQAIGASFRRFDLTEGAQPVALALSWHGAPRYPLLRALADGIVQALPKTLAAGLPLVLVFAHDFGKSVGEILRHELGVTNDIISVDGIHLEDFDYIDIGEVIYPAFVVPVVVKSLVFPEVRADRAELIER
jgi:ethanolamine utilization protein EutA